MCWEASVLKFHTEIFTHTYVVGDHAHQWVKFGSEPDLPEEECQQLLLQYMPEHVRNTKITQRLFIKWGTDSHILMLKIIPTLTLCTDRYMNRRCSFLDTLSAFNLNMGRGEYIADEERRWVRTDTRQLGSTLMTTMIKEVEDFCDPLIKENWSLKPHQQVTITTTSIYKISWSHYPSPSLSALSVDLWLQGWWFQSGSGLTPPRGTVTERQNEVYEDWCQDSFHGVSP